MQSAGQELRTARALLASATSALASAAQRAARSTQPAAPLGQLLASTGEGEVAGLSEIVGLVSRGFRSWASLADVLNNKTASTTTAR